MLLGYSIGPEPSFLKILTIFVMLAYNSLVHKKGSPFLQFNFDPVKSPKKRRPGESRGPFRQGRDGNSGDSFSRFFFFILSSLPHPEKFRR
jgi:hypothetical protein